MGVSAFVKEVGIDVSCHFRTKVIIPGIRIKLQEKYLPKDEYTLYKSREGTMLIRVR